MGILSSIFNIFGGKSESHSSGSSSTSYGSSSYNDSPRSRGAVYNLGGDAHCSHSWSYSNKGADGNSIYQCTKCGMREKRM